MFDKFSDASHAVMAGANRVAARYGHATIGTEHILLGVVSGDGNIATDVLRARGVKPGDVEAEVERILGVTDVCRASSPLLRKGLTERSERAIKHAQREADNWSKGIVDPGHLLIGLMAVTDGVAAEAISNLGLTAREVKYHVGLRLPILKERSDGDHLRSGIEFLAYALDNPAAAAAHVLKIARETSAALTRYEAALRKIEEGCFDATIVSIAREALRRPTT